MSLLQLPGPESIKVLKVSHLPPSWIFADSALSRLVIDDFVWRIVFLRTSRKSNFFDVHFYWGTRWGSRSRHCARSRKVAGSISDGVIEIIHWHNPSGGTMALGFFHPQTEMSTRTISWGKGWQPYHFHVPIVLKSGSLKLLEPSGPLQACNGIALPLLYLLTGER